MKIPTEIAYRLHTLTHTHTIITFEGFSGSFCVSISSSQSGSGGGFAAGTFGHGSTGGGGG